MPGCKRTQVAFPDLLASVRTGNKHIWQRSQPFEHGPLMHTPPWRPHIAPEHS